MNELVVIEVDLEMLDKIKSAYSKYSIPNSGEYVYFYAKFNDIEITGYNGKKAIKKVTFKGIDALKEAKKWDSKASLYKAKEKKESDHFINTKTQIGSDEVGVGDILLPLVVVGVYLHESDYEKIIKYHIVDSKKLNDEKILELGPTLISEFEYAKSVLSNEKYNMMINKGNNINAIKAKMHNAVLYYLKEKHPEVKNVFIDQFVSPSCYYSYLTNTEKVLKGITFEVKGESKFPSVALGSVIARYLFLKEKEKLENLYQIKFPFGAGNDADKFMAEFIKTHSKDELKRLVKSNFKNCKEFIS